MEVTETKLTPEAIEKAARRDKTFTALVDDWLRARANTSDEMSEEDEDGDDIAFQILTTPTGVDSSIFRKFEVIDYIITKHGEATWVERMALTALDAIKADLLRFLNRCRMAHRAAVHLPAKTDPGGRLAADLRRLGVLRNKEDLK